MRLSFLLVGLMLAGVLQARAQINTEKERWFEEGTRGILGGDLTLLSGNTEAISIGGRVRLDVRQGKQYAFLVGHARYGESRQQRYQESYFSHARYNYDLTRRFVGEGFAQVERNAFTLLQLRALLGGGLRFRYAPTYPRDQQRIGLFQGTALMYEFENLDAAEAGDHPATVNGARWSNYVNLRFRLNDRTSLIHTVYVQAHLDDFADVRFLDEASLVLGITRHVRFDLTFNLRYDSRPPGDVKSTDLALRNGMTVTF